MKINQVKSEGLSRTFEVVITDKDIKPVFEKKLQDHGKNLSIHGFRKGKVPIHILKAHRGQQAFHDAAEWLIYNSRQKALEQEKIVPAAEPKITVSKLSDETSNIEYTMVLDVMPELPKLDFTKLSLEKLVADLKDKDVLDRLKERLGDYPVYKTAAKTKKAEMECALKVDIQFEINDKKDKKSEGVRIDLREEVKEDPIVKAAVGKVVGDNFEADISSPDDAKRKVIAKVKVLEVLERIETKMDDALAKEIGFEDFKTLEKVTMDGLKREAEMKSRACLKRQVLDFIDTSAQFPVPEGMQKSELDNIIQQVKADMHMHAEKEEFDEESFREEYASIADRRVRLGLVISEYGQENKIEISNKELSEEIYRLAAQNRANPDDYIKAMRRNPALLQSVRAPIYEDKVVDSVLATKVKLKDKKVSLAELEKIYDEVLTQDAPSHECSTGCSHDHHNEDGKKTAAKKSTNKKAAKTET